MFRPVAILLLLTGHLWAQSAAAGDAGFEAERVKAYALIEQGRRAEAQKAITRLLKQAPNDGGILFRHGYLLYLEAAEKPDSSRAKKLRREAREYLIRAQATGLDQPLIGQLLADIAEDGSVTRKIYSKVPAADAAMHDAEKAFTKRDLEAATRLYTRALELDPTNYWATVYIGDVHFVRQNYAEAAKWFEKATLIDPHLEVAHRYWGDALVKSGRPVDARDKLIDAVIAEPYNGLPWRALRAWADANKVKPRHAATRVPNAEISFADGGINLGLDPDGGPLVMAYAMARAAEAQKVVARGTKYRQTVAEEVQALRVLLQVAGEMADAPEAEAKITQAVRADLDELRRVFDAGLAEPYVLFVRANDDLVEDYAEYRAEHRAKLADYLFRFYLRIEP